MRGRRRVFGWAKTFGKNRSPRGTAWKRHPTFGSRFGHTLAQVRQSKSRQRSRHLPSLIQADSRVPSPIALRSLAWQGFVRQPRCITSHSSRRRFAARLNSGVRRSPLTSPLQEELAKLHTTTATNDSMWHQKPNSWTRDLSARERHEVAIRLASRVLGSKRTAQGSEYALSRENERITVKLASVGASGGKPFISWQSIQLADNFTHVCFIALYPEDVRIFLVPRAGIEIENLSLKRGSESNYQLATKNIHGLFAWMVKHELHDIARA